MKRSIALLISNILATIYAVILLRLVWTVGSVLIESGDLEPLKAMGILFEIIFELLGDYIFEYFAVYFVLLALLCSHVIAVVVGCLIGWIAYFCKKSFGAKIAAILYVIATICFIGYIYLGLPMIIFGFVGAHNQEKINNRIAA